MPRSHEGSSFISNVDKLYRDQFTDPEVYKRHRDYLKSLGGQRVQSLPLSSNTVALAKGYNLTNHYSDFQFLQQTSFKETNISSLPLETAKSASSFPWIYEGVQNNSVVNYTVYTQEVNTEQEKGAFVIGTPQLPVADTLISVNENHTVHFIFNPPTTRLLLSPHFFVEDTFQFDHVPTVIDRAFRVYANACRTNRIELFEDKQNAHWLYKYFPGLKVIAISYTLGDENRMTPIWV